jgi:hypothetical protein
VLLDQLALEREAARTRVEQLQRERDERLRQVEDIRRQALALARTQDEVAEVERAAAAKRLQVIANAEREIAAVRAEEADKAVELYLQLQKQSVQQELQALANKYRSIYAEIARMEAELGEKLTNLREAAAEAEVRERVELLRKGIEAEAKAFEEAEEIRIDLRAKEFSDEKAFNEFKQKELLRIQLEGVRKRLEALRKLDAELSDEETQALIRRLEAQEAVLDLRMRSLTQSVDDAAEKMKARLQQLGEALAGVATLYEALLERQAAAAERALERQLSAVDRWRALLVAQIERGSDAAVESIAALDRRQAELEQQQEALKRQAQRREAALAAFRAYAGQLQKGVPPAQALVNVIRDFQVIAQLIRSLPTFYEGTEYISAKTHAKLFRTSKDAFLARVHEGERIVPAHINRHLQGVRNEDLPALAAGSSVSFDADALLQSLAVIVKSKSKTERKWRTI